MPKPNVPPLPLKVLTSQTSKAKSDAAAMPCAQMQPVKIELEKSKMQIAQIANWRLHTPATAQRSKSPPVKGSKAKEPHALPPAPIAASQQGVDMQPVKNDLTDPLPKGPPPKQTPKQDTEEQDKSFAANLHEWKAKELPFKAPPQACSHPFGKASHTHASSSSGSNLKHNV